MPDQPTLQPLPEPTTIERGEGQSVVWENFDHQPTTNQED